MVNEMEVVLTLIEPMLWGGRKGSKQVRIHLVIMFVITAIRKYESVKIL